MTNGHLIFVSVSDNSDPALHILAQQLSSMVSFDTYCQLFRVPSLQQYFK
jgi:hypothetical protein